MVLRRDVLDDSIHETAVDARLQLLTAMPQPQRGQRWSGDRQERAVRGAYDKGKREGIETGRIEPGMGNEQHVWAGSDAVESKVTARIRLRALAAPLHPHLGPSER